METRWPNLTDRRDISIARLHARSLHHLWSMLLSVCRSPQNCLYVYTCWKDTWDSRRRFRRRSRGPAASRIAFRADPIKSRRAIVESRCRSLGSGSCLACAVGTHWNDCCSNSELAKGAFVAAYALFHHASVTPLKGELRCTPLSAILAFSACDCSRSSRSSRIYSPAPTLLDEFMQKKNWIKLQESFCFHYNIIPECYSILI